MDSEGTVGTVQATADLCGLRPSGHRKRKGQPEKEPRVHY